MNFALRTLSPLSKLSFHWASSAVLCGALSFIACGGSAPPPEAPPPARRSLWERLVGHRSQAPWLRVKNAKPFAETY